MGLSVFSGGHHYSKIFSQCNEYSGRISVKAGKRPIRMEIEFPGFSQDLPKIWKTRDRPSCILLLTPSSTIHCMDARPIQSGHRRNAIKSVKGNTVCVSTFCLIRCVLQKVESCRKNDSYNPDMTHSMMVSSTSGNVNVTSGVSHFVKTK